MKSYKNISTAYAHLEKDNERIKFLLEKIEKEKQEIYELSEKVHKYEYAENDVDEETCMDYQDMVDFLRYSYCKVR